MSYLLLANGNSLALSIGGDLLLDTEPQVVSFAGLVGLRPYLLGNTGLRPYLQGEGGLRAYTDGETGER